MRAIVQDTYGSTDVLVRPDIDRPAVSAGEVLVGVHAAGVDRGVWHPERYARSTRAASSAA